MSGTRLPPMPTFERSSDDPSRDQDISARHCEQRPSTLDLLKWTTLSARADFSFFGPRRGETGHGPADTGYPPQSHAGFGFQPGPRPPHLPHT